jgi:uncharacterized protein YkwD
LTSPTRGGHNRWDSGSTHAPEEEAIARKTSLQLITLSAAFALGALALVMLAQAPAGSADPALDSEESAFLTLINDYRAQNGLSQLVVQEDLAEAADWYATDMATKNYYGDYTYCFENFGIQSAHCDSTGGLPQNRIPAFGYGPATIGENSAGGFSSAQSVFDAWKGSPGHNQNMLQSFWVAIGIGRACQAGTRYGCYWVTDFGNVNSPPGANHPYGTSATPSPSASPTESPTPTPEPRLWQDLDCDDAITSADALALLRGNVGLPAAAGAAATACPVPGQRLAVGSFTRTWGDIDCSGEIDALDSVALLRLVSGIITAVGPSSCPNPGVPY